MSVYFHPKWICVEVGFLEFLWWCWNRGGGWSWGARTPCPQKEGEEDRVERAAVGHVELGISGAEFNMPRENYASLDYVLALTAQVLSHWLSKTLKTQRARVCCSQQFLTAVGVSEWSYLLYWFIRKLCVSLPLLPCITWACNTGVTELWILSHFSDLSYWIMSCLET